MLCGRRNEDRRPCSERLARRAYRLAGPKTWIPAVLSGRRVLWRDRHAVLARHAARSPSRRPLAGDERRALACARNGLWVCRRDRRRLPAYRRARLDVARNTAWRIARGAMAVMGRGSRARVVRAGTD